MVGAPVKWASLASSNPRMCVVQTLQDCAILILTVAHRSCRYRVFPNCTARAKGVRQNLIGQQLLEGQDISALKVRRPVDRGFVVHWDLEREIWGHAFANAIDVLPANSGLLLTEPLFSLPAMQDATQQVTASWHSHIPPCAAPTESVL